mmetsp:Transcript_9061/g.27124  ORF Transcript_9061/g.27124 Transcript_9061/m.27124 type:complete len:252 (-) Transcript_9061:51-806(-)
MAPTRLAARRAMAPTRLAARRAMAPRHTLRAPFSTAEDPRQKAIDAATAFVVKVGRVREGRDYSEAVARGVVDALLDPSSGVSPSALMPTLQALAGSYEIGEDNGLDALAEAVEREVLANSGREKVHCVVRGPGGEGEAFRVEAFEGTSLYDVIRRGGDSGARTLQEYLECACSGVMACSTCHVYVADAWAGKVGEPCDAELDMLDLAADPRPTSRLGCQIVLSKELDGVELEVPADANNLMDHIPFEDHA